ncbi:hypothetical protein HanOQP8_Chr14g0549351 [Helianthus annuus]|nr:hypothetical protein HanOQP8_Chr14g0549351 [Helianthus annuus]
MDHMKQQYGGSLSFTERLFGPKDAPSTSSSGLFSSVFGPSSTVPLPLPTGLGRDSKNTGLSKKPEFGGTKPPTQDYKTQRTTGEKDGNPVYQNGIVEPCYLSSSIYYGGQEVYSSNTHTNRPQCIFKKHGGDDDPSASRGNWWQGSLYY